jgi:hypothetical protein
MSPERINVKRLSIDLTEEQYKRLSLHVPWGLMRPLFSEIVDDLNDIMDRAGPEPIISAIISGMLKPGKIIKTMKTEESDGNTI